MLIAMISFPTMSDCLALISFRSIQEKSKHQFYFFLSLDFEKEKYIVKLGVQKLHCRCGRSDF